MRRRCCSAFAIGHCASERRANPSSLRDPRHSTKVLACLGIVYLVWGSSFLFTKLAVQNLPPALFAGIRFVTAGVLLALIAEFYGGGLPTRLTEWRHVTIGGFFMVFVSNGLNTWSIQYLPSNETALLNGTSAFWIAGLGVFGRRGHPLTRFAVLGLVEVRKGPVTRRPGDIVATPKLNERLEEYAEHIKAIISRQRGLDSSQSVRAVRNVLLTK